MDKYILVSWPQSQRVMDHPRYEECFYAIPVNHTIEDTTGGTVLVPEDLYAEVYGNS